MTQLPEETIRLFQDVGNQLDKSESVVWKKAVSSLEATNQYLESSEEARAFMERYMLNLISILADQEPAKIGDMERNCVEESLHIAISLIAKDLRIQIVGNQSELGECKVLDVLGCMLNKKRRYYSRCKNLRGLPEVRMALIEKFRTERGFWYLTEYLSKCVGTPKFPPLDLLHPILIAVKDALPGAIEADSKDDLKVMKEKDAILLSKAVIGHISSCSDKQLKELPRDDLNLIGDDLLAILDRLVVRHRKEMHSFYEFWLTFTHKLLMSEYLSLRLLGSDQISFLIEVSEYHRPLPKKFHVSGAGSIFVNGVYEYGGYLTPDGYSVPSSEDSYVRTIPETEAEGGKTLTLFRCTMRSQARWWFISEADEEQPGTNRDIDYYLHRSRERGQEEPPSDNWVTHKTATVGIDPPPTLRPEGILVPPGEESNSLEHRLANWVVDNNLMDAMLGASPNVEVVDQALPLIKFLFSRSKSNPSVDEFEKDDMVLCVRDSHLQIAWDAAIQSTDATLSAQICDTLGSMLNMLSVEMAVALLRFVHATLLSSREVSNVLPKVAAFCQAAKLPVMRPGFKFGSDDLNEERLQLIGSFLAHPDALSLEHCDYIKKHALDFRWLLQKYGTHVLGFLDLRSLLQVASTSKWIQWLVYKEMPSLWINIDFSNTVPGRFGFIRMRSGLHDEDLDRLLSRVDAQRLTKRICLNRCCSILGPGLEPLRGSRVLESIDLRGTFAACEDQPLVGEILRSMSPYNLSEVILSDARASHGELLHGLRQARVLQARRDGTRCSFCPSPVCARVTDNGDGEEHSTDSTALMSPYVGSTPPAVRCGECRRYFCRRPTCPANVCDCSECGMASCPDCKLVQQCVTCSATFCKYCKSNMYCCDVCNETNCWTCKNTVFCSSCSKSVCEGCNDSLAVVTACADCNVRKCTGCYMHTKQNIKHCSRCSDTFCTECRDYDVIDGVVACGKCSAPPTRKRAADAIM